jgi:hypothetical protein
VVAVAPEDKKHLLLLEHFYGLHQLGLLVFAWFVSAVAVVVLVGPSAAAAVLAVVSVGKITSQLHRVHLIQ